VASAPAPPPAAAKKAEPAAVAAVPEVEDALDPPADAAPAASRRGGALLIAGVLALAGLILFLVLREGDEPARTPVAATATPTATAAPAQIADEIRLRAPGGGRGEGTMTVFLQDGRLGFALEATNVPATGEDAAYAVWFTGPGARARRLGFTDPVGADGTLGIQGPSEADAEAFPQLYATHANVVVSRERTADGKRPGRVVLSGRLPRGR
jgi:hypothetical protein